MFREATQRALTRAIDGLVSGYPGLTDEERDDLRQHGWLRAVELADKYDPLVPGSFAGYVSKALAREFPDVIRRARFAGTASDGVLLRAAEAIKEGRAADLSFARGDLDDVDGLADDVDRAHLLARIRDALERHSAGDDGAEMLAAVVCDGERPGTVAARYGLTTKAAFAARTAAAARLAAVPELRTLRAELNPEDDDPPADQPPRVFVVMAPPPVWIYTPGAAADVLSPGAYFGQPASSVRPAALRPHGRLFSPTSATAYDGPWNRSWPRPVSRIGAAPPRCPPARWGPARAAPSG
jgi:hypothetical protein